MSLLGAALCRRSQRACHKVGREDPLTVRSPRRLEGIGLWIEPGLRGEGRKGGRTAARALIMVAAPASQHRGTVAVMNDRVFMVVRGNCGS